VQVVYEMV